MSYYSTVERIWSFVSLCFLVDYDCPITMIRGMDEGYVNFRNFFFPLRFYSLRLRRVRVTNNRRCSLNNLFYFILFCYGRLPDFLHFFFLFSFFPPLLFHVSLIQQRSFLSPQRRRITGRQNSRLDGTNVQVFVRHFAPRRPRLGVIQMQIH